MKATKRRMPAEWEKQSAVQLTWPHKGTDWAPMLPEITAVYEQIAREISKREGLIIVVPEGMAQPIADCQLSIINSNDTWARDHGFITVFEEEFSPSSLHPSSPTLHLLDFKFNGWGEKFPAELDNAINRQLYESMAAANSKLYTLNSKLIEYEPHLDFVLEGGSIESDGKGTVFTTTCCLMAPHRNQPLTQQQIEERLKEYLGAERIIWLNHGSLVGDDTDGHIDTLVRICPDDTLLCIGCDDKDDEQYEELQLMEKELQTLRTIDGRPYRLLRLPMPRPIYDGEADSSRFTLHTSLKDRLPATYANYLVINGAVLVPTYAQPDLDTEAMRIIQQAFPDRDIIGIDCRPVIRQHGSLHCCTMQYY